MEPAYDIAIIGMGCAGSHMIIELLNKQPELKIIVLEQTANIVEKKWSFWEKGNGKWDHLILKKWNHATFHSASNSLKLELAPYEYKTISSLDFIAFAKAQLKQSLHSTFVTSTVQKTTEKNHLVTITHETGTVTANYVFDSRIDDQFFKNQQAITIQQHFKGWTIETDENLFDDNEFTMMDYRLVDKGTTSFTYVLPFNPRKALVEFTYFSPNTVSKQTYDYYLKKYIQENLKIENYNICDVEQGIIPMTTYRFDQHHKTRIIKIGTAGGWVKPSTGYSFKMSEKKAEILVDNLIHKRPLTDGLYNAKFAHYDRTILDILYNNNELGPDLFYKMYSRIKAPQLLKFLDEDTSVTEDIKIMSSQTSSLMIKSFLKNLLSILIILSFFSCNNKKEAITISEVKEQNEISDTKTLKTINFTQEYIATSFDFPVGKPNAHGYYNAQKFKQNNHLGDDWNAVTGGNSDLGDPIYSIAHGYVKSAQDHGSGWGNVVQVLHQLPDSTMIVSLYAHCDSMLVTKGDWVQKGEQIATIGNANGAYLAHLHFEIRNDTTLGIGGGYSSDTNGYLDPTQFIKKH